MRVIIACGGTGGHLFPGVAVAEELLTRHHKVKLLVSERALEQEVLTALPGCQDAHRIGVQAISAVGLSSKAGALSFACRLAQAVGECTALYYRFQPHVVLGMGGYTSAPAVLAARAFRPRRTATLIHESNAIPGRANKLVGRLVDRVAVGLPDCGQHFPNAPVTVTGTPIRAAVRQGERFAEAHVRLGLQPDLPTVLVTGGSQGAHGINEGIACALPWLDGWENRLQFLHLSGAKDEAFVRDAYRVNGFNARVMAFCHEMQLAYSVASLVIARAGAATLAELAAYGLPSILIPYPHATGNHQQSNAEVFKKIGAARVYTQKELETGMHAARGERLAGALIDLFGKPGRLAEMATAARSLAKHNAAGEIAALVEECGSRRLPQPGHAPAAAGATVPNLEVASR